MSGFTLSSYFLSQKIIIKVENYCDYYLLSGIYLSPGETKNVPAIIPDMILEI